MVSLEIPVWMDLKGQSFLYRQYLSTCEDNRAVQDPDDNPEVLDAPFMTFVEWLVKAGAIATPVTPGRLPVVALGWDGH